MMWEKSWLQIWECRNRYAGGTEEVKRNKEMCKNKNGKENKS